MKALIIPNLHKNGAKEFTKTVALELERLGACVLMQSNLESKFKSINAFFLAEEQAYSECDAVITIGGDGTILHSAKLCARYDKPILGFNLGRMGFLATAEINELEKLRSLVERDYLIDKRLLLSIKLNDGDKYKKTALNDVVISKSNVTQIMDIDVFCDNILVNTFRADGVVVATPTGSTAYSLSAGGPILDAKIEGIVVTPICAHSLNSPPMVFSAARSIKVKIYNKAQLSCDGANTQQIDTNDEITVSLSEKSIELICFNNASQFEAIDKKLKGR